MVSPQGRLFRRLRHDEQFTCLARRTYRGLARRARGWAAKRIEEQWASEGSAVFGVIDPGATEVRVPCGISASFIWSDRGRLTIRGGDGDALTCSSRGESACRISPPRPSSYRRLLYDAPLHGAVMAHGMTGPHPSRRPIDLRGGIGIGSLRPVARPRGHDVPGPRHAVVIFRPGRQRAERRPERAPIVRAQMVVVVRPPTEPVVIEGLRRRAGREERERRAHCSNHLPHRSLLTVRSPLLEVWAGAAGSTSGATQVALLMRRHGPALATRPWATGPAPRSRTGGCTTPRFRFRDIGVIKLCFTPRRGGLRNQLLMPGTRLMVDAPSWRPNCEPRGLQVQIASTKSMAPSPGSRL